MKNILFTGYRSEFVLGSLSKELKKDNKFSVYIEDFEKPVDFDFYKNLENLYLFTSQHISIDTKSYQTLYPHAQYYMAPIELIIRLSPKKSFYTPHDWALPLEQNDYFFLHYFDLIFFDDKLNLPSEFVPVINLGNVKLFSTEDILPSNCRGVYFVNNYRLFSQMYYSRNFKLLWFLRICRACRIYIKFHNEKELTNLEKDLKERGYLLITKEISAVSILSYFQGLIISDSYGSILAEAKQSGKNALIIKFIESDSSSLQSAYMKKYNARFFRVIDLLRSLRKPKESRLNLKPFQLDRFISLLDTLD